MQKQKLRMEKLLRLSAARAPRSWSIDHMHIWHSQPFHGVTCVLLDGGCNLTKPRNIVAEISPLDLYAHRAWFRTSTRQKRALSARMPAVDRQGGGQTVLRRGYSCRWGSWHTRESSKSILSTMTTFHVTVNG